MPVTTQNIFRGAEDPQTTFTLLIRIPPRPPPGYLPKFLFRENKPASQVFTIRSVRDPDDYSYFTWHHLDDMKLRWKRIKAEYFPPELRCKHISEGKEKNCEAGCYFLEKGGQDTRHWHCRRTDCDGHALWELGTKTRDGVACFGEKGERLVCMDHSRLRR